MMRIWGKLKTGDSCTFYGKGGVEIVRTVHETANLGSRPGGETDIIEITFTDGTVRTGYADAVLA